MVHAHSGQVYKAKKNSAQKTKEHYECSTLTDGVCLCVWRTALILNGSHTF